MNDNQDSGRTEVWCLRCRARFDAAGPESVADFSPQGVSIDLMGGITMNVVETYLDYEHLACGTRTRFDLIGAYADPDLPREHLIEVDYRVDGEMRGAALLLGPSILTVEPRLGSTADELVLDETDHAEMRRSYEVMGVLRDEAFAKIHWGGLH